jgi:hypothetical protein
VRMARGAARRIEFWCAATHVMRQGRGINCSFRS